MATREIWNGKGELPDGAVFFTTDDGTFRGRPYVRDRVRQSLSRSWRRLWTLEERQEVIRRTVDNDEWITWRGGCTVGSVCRDAERAGISIVYGELRT